MKRKLWSQKVTESSKALYLEKGVFTFGPRKMAKSLKQSADQSQRRKSSSFRSAMSMLCFYQNRAGSSLSSTRKQAIEKAKIELRKLYKKKEPSNCKEKRKKTKIRMQNRKN